MRFPILLDGKSLVETFNNVYEILTGFENFVFEAMVKATASRKNPFVAPTGPAEHAAKRDEIVAIFRSPAAGHGQKVAFALFEALYSNVKRCHGVTGVSVERLLEAITFGRESDEVVRLTDDLHWVVDWCIPSRGQKTPITCALSTSTWGAIVPTYTLNYMSSATAAYKSGKHDVAVALMSIAAEATLRDVLATFGYTFEHGASPVDAFAWSPAEVTVDAAGNRYTIEFKTTVPKHVADFYTSFPSRKADVKVRRMLKVSGSGHRIDIHMRVPPALVDHWASDTVEVPGRRSVTGLGAALDIARNTERCLTPAHLPLDFDSVLKAVRNNLIHLSGDALATPLQEFDDQLAGGGFTLRHFLEREDMLLDFVTTIPRFVNEQYLQLRRDGKLI